MKTTGTVFDFGGVMTTMNAPARVRPIAEALGIAWPVVERGFARYRRLMDGAEMTMEEMYRRIWSDAGIAVSDADLARIVEADITSFLHRNERTLALMRALKAGGTRIGILTNMPPSFAVRFRETFPDYIALADAMVISGEERLYKPRREIYDLLRERIGLPADELVFIDDSEENCRGAEAAGWRAIRFVSDGQLAADLKALGLAVG